MKRQLIGVASGLFLLSSNLHADYVGGNIQWAPDHFTNEDVVSTFTKGSVADKTKKLNKTFKKTDWKTVGLALEYGHELDNGHTVEGRFNILNAKAVQSVQCEAGLKAEGADTDVTTIVDPVDVSVSRVNLQAIYKVPVTPQALEEMNVVVHAGAGVSGSCAEETYTFEGKDDAKKLNAAKVVAILNAKAKTENDDEAAKVNDKAVTDGITKDSAKTVKAVSKWSLGPVTHADAVYYVNEQFSVKVGANAGYNFYKDNAWAWSGDWKNGIAFDVFTGVTFNF